MASNTLKQQIAAMRRSFFDEGLLDEYFVRLENLVDEETPNFIEEIITLFLENSSGVIEKMEPNLDIIFNQNISGDETSKALVELNNLVHAIIGSSSSIGAKKVNLAASELKGKCYQGGTEGAKASFNKLKNEFNDFKRKLKPYIELLQQAKGAAN